MQCAALLQDSVWVVHLPCFHSAPWLSMVEILSYEVCALRGPLFNMYRILDVVAFLQFLQFLLFFCRPAGPKISPKICFLQSLISFHSIFRSSCPLRAQSMPHQLSIPVPGVQAERRMKGTPPLSPFCVARNDWSPVAQVPTPHLLPRWPNEAATVPAPPQAPGGVHRVPRGVV